MGGPMDGLTRFPCWCRATYSYGGETKKDLGFVEGDLIEALNAGDGLWWMGRLRRDPRAIGLFPSNFVKILDQSFQPTPNSRSTSPPSQAPSQRTSPAKSSVFRKPFQAYEEIGKRASLDNFQEKEGTPESEKKNKFRPYSSMKAVQAPTGTSSRESSGRPTPTKDENPFRIPPPPPRRGSRSPLPPRVGPSESPAPVPSYAQPTTSSMYRAASPRPEYSQPPSPAASRPHSPLPTTYHDGTAYPQFLPRSRQPSPTGSEQQYQAPNANHPFGYRPSRAPSPAPVEEEFASSPPPPPPVHRVAYQPSRPSSPQHMYEPRSDFYNGSNQTPIPPSPVGNGSHMTPSPLRDAMNDVMSSLQDMSVLQESRQPMRTGSPPAVWSPDAYEITRAQSRAEHRAQSSLGFAWNTDSYRHEGDENGTSSLPSSRDGLPQDDLPQLDTFVQRMETQLRHAPSTATYSSDNPPAPPLKGSEYTSARPATSSSYSSQSSQGGFQLHSQQQYPQLRHRKSAYELGRQALNRTFTTRTNATNSTENSSATRSSNSTQLTGHSLMSGQSASGISATSAGSMARRKFGFGSLKEKRPLSAIDTKSTPDISSTARSMVMSESSGSGPSYHQSHDSRNQSLLNPTADWFCDPMVLTPSADWSQEAMESAGVFGGLGTPRAKKSNFFKKMMNTAKTTARTGAANARSTIGSRPGSRSGAGSPTKNFIGERGVTSIAGGLASMPGSAASDMGLGGSIDWMQVRRDVNRSNSLSQKERDERAERCQMLDIPVLSPIDQFQELAEGGEGLDGLPVVEPTDFNLPNLALVDKSTRFLQGIPSMVSAAALAQNYVCRQYRSDVQRLRAIFTWTTERIAWEEDFEGEVDARRAIQTKRGCSEEIAVVVHEMCCAVCIQSEVVHGYLKAPGEAVDLDMLARPNHWWNAVIIDGEWRIMDCSLANPTNPRRSAYGSSASSQAAESWYFLARPMEACYTHIPVMPEQQHIVPSVPYEILAALPCACPTYFRHGVELTNFETSLLQLENLEMAHLHLNVPDDVECIAETEAKAFARDDDGDVFESGDTVQKKAFAQAEWVSGRKRFTIKAILPGDEGLGVLKVYAGKRGLMHSIKDNPHSLALSLALSHHGQNPPYEFVTKHPTPHAQRHDLYVASPQCSRLVMNNTFVFCVRQHPSSLSRFTPDTWGSGSQARPTSPNPYVRPASAMSMVSATVSQSGSNYSDGSNSGQPMTAAQQKPAKLAIQSPSQKIIRLTRKQEHSSRQRDEDQGLTTSWETAVKIGERGTWRGLVLADRSARWCVFAEWECI